MTLAVINSLNGRRLVAVMDRDGYHARVRKFMSTSTRADKKWAATKRVPVSWILPVDEAMDAAVLREAAKFPLPKERS